MNESRTQFLNYVKQDIEKLTPNQFYSLTDIYAIKKTFNELATGGKSLNIIQRSVAMFYNKKQYQNNIIVFSHNGLYNVSF